MTKTKIEYSIELEKKFQEFNVFFHASGSYDRIKKQTLTLDENIEIEPFVNFNKGNNLVSIGSFSYFNGPVPGNDLKMEVGRYCSIAGGLEILGPNHPIDRFTSSLVTYDKRNIICKKSSEYLKSSIIQKPNNKAKNNLSVKIGHDVWLGANVTLARGINIGHGSIIANGSVVTKDVPPYSIVGGNPAKIIRKRFDSNIIDELLKTQWWQYKYTDFNINSDINIHDFINYIQSNEFEPYKPKKLTSDFLLNPNFT